jgi:muramoyltetrapeptide carboxypeptidase
MTMFADDDVDVVQCLQGGYGAAQIIPHLDFDVIANNPKPFVGYSDITALHTAIRHHTGLVTFYGPGLAGVDDSDRDRDQRKFVQQHLLRAITSTDSLGVVPRRPDDDYLRVLSGGRVSAEMVGGCLWLLGQTIGTPWQIDLGGRIFFFEDVHAPAWYIDGILNQMTQAGMLKDVVGVVVGELVDCDWKENAADFPQMLSIEDVLERYLEPLQVPVLYGLPLGHGKHLVTTPLGAAVTLDAAARTLTLDEPALEAR